MYPPLFSHIASAAALAGPEGLRRIRRYVAGPRTLRTPGSPTSRAYPPSGGGKTAGIRGYPPL